MVEAEAVAENAGALGGVGVAGVLGVAGAVGVPGTEETPGDTGVIFADSHPENAIAVNPARKIESDNRLNAEICISSFLIA